MSSAVSLASESACSTGPRVRSIRSWVSCSNFARVIDMFRCFGPGRVGGDEGQVELRRDVVEESSTLARSAAS